MKNIGGCIRKLSLYQKRKKGIEADLKIVNKNSKIENWKRNW